MADNQNYEIEKCRRLWAKVLMRAFEDEVGITMGSQSRTSPRKRKQIMNEAREWIMSENDGAGSFRWVCRVLDCDYEGIRKIRRRFTEMPDLSALAAACKKYRQKYEMRQVDVARKIDCHYQTISQIERNISLKGGWYRSGRYRAAVAQVILANAPEIYREYFSGSAA